MPVDISREAKILNESDENDDSDDSDDSVFGPENDIMVSPSPAYMFRKLNPNGLEKPPKKERSAQERLDRLASAMQDEGLAIWTLQRGKECHNLLTIEAPVTDAVKNY